MVSSGLLCRAFSASFGPRVGTRSYQPTLSHSGFFRWKKSLALYLLSPSSSDVLEQVYPADGLTVAKFESRLSFRIVVCVLGGARCAGKCLDLIAHKVESFCVQKARGTQGLW